MDNQPGTRTENDLYGNLTMRDLFAAFAMNGLIAGGRYQDAEETDEKVAADAYWYADAMMAERGK